jgi:hypothetical protein
MVAEYLKMDTTMRLPGVSGFAKGAVALAPDPEIALYV